MADLPDVTKDPRIETILGLIMRLAAGDLSAGASASDKGDELDGIIMGLNMLGEELSERVVSLGGPMVRNPRLLRTRVGASIDDLVRDELEQGDCRVLSGSVLSGRRAAGWGAYLWRYHHQVTAVREGRERTLFGWLRPGGERFSAARVFFSALSSRRRRFALSTSQQGSRRAMVPIGLYEEVVPLDILPTQLLRAILVGDTDTAQALGCLELDEEDLALCSFVCLSKYDFGPFLRETLDTIQRGG